MSDMSLSEEFAASAQHYREGTVTQPMLLAKFALLMRHTLTEDADKNAVAATLFDTGMAHLDVHTKRAKPGTIGDAINEEVSKIFQQLLTPESVGFIPSHAARDLAAATLTLLRKGEAAVVEDFVDYKQDRRPDWLNAYKDDATRLAETTLSFADQFKKAIEANTVNVTTNHPVVASKPLVLTRTNGAAASQ